MCKREILWKIYRLGETDFVESDFQESNQRVPDNRAFLEAQVTGGKLDVELSNSFEPAERPGGIDRSFVARGEEGGEEGVQEGLEEGEEGEGVAVRFRDDPVDAEDERLALGHEQAEPPRHGAAPD